MEEYGKHVFRRVDLHVTESEKQAIMARFRKGMRSLGGRPVTGRNDTDGSKYFFERGWLLVRASGTEPLIRMYAEADDEETVDGMLREAAGRG
jgi:phosphomannomutase